MANEKNGTTRKLLIGLGILAAAALAGAVVSHEGRMAVVERVYVIELKENLREIKAAVQKVDDRMRAHVEKHNAK